MNFTKMAHRVFFLVIGLGLAVSGYSQSFLTNGLVAYFPFDGNANDQSGNSHNGTVDGAVLTTDRFGQSGQAYQFNGLNAFISVGNEGQFTFTNGQFSLSVWAAVAQVPNSVMYLVGHDNGTGNTPKWFLQFGPLNIPIPPQGNYVGFHVNETNNGGQGYFLATTAYAPTLGSWHQFIVTQNGTNYTLFMDGVSVSNSTNYLNDNGTQITGVGGPPVLPSGITEPLTIGMAEGGGYFSGKLDDVRIYNRALSTSEVQQLYVYESGPRVNLIQIVQPSLSNLTLGTNYQLQVSTDLNSWTNQGAVFTATNSSEVYPQYFQVQNWDQLFFRLQAAP